MTAAAEPVGSFVLVPVALSVSECDWLDVVRGDQAREDYLAGLLTARMPREFRETSVTR